MGFFEGKSAANTVWLATGTFATENRGDLQLRFLVLSQKNVRNPNHHYFSKKYRSTPPICTAVRLQFVLQYFWCPYALRKGKYCQYSSHLYRSTPPICIAIRLPFVSQYFWENLGGCGHQDVPHICYTKGWFPNHLCNHFGPQSKWLESRQEPIKLAKRVTT